MTTTTEQRRTETLKELHDSADFPFPCVGLDDAVVQMAIRYGTTRALCTRMDLDYELVDRARNRRFAAMLRLVTALKHQQS